MKRDLAIKLLTTGPDGVVEWNHRRSEEGDDPPFLGAADLRGADLAGANLRFVSFALARLDGSNLFGADLSGASFRQADLFDADLSETTLVNADFRAADLTSCNLVAANCTGVDFTGADLNGANLNHANLTAADLTGTDLRNTDLSAVNFRNARLIGTQMHGARLTNAELAGTVIACTLDGVTDLDLTIHHMPSTIAVSSVLSITDRTPLHFLRGCGLRYEEIEHFRKTLIKPVTYNACFLTYHESDEKLANKIHRDLQEAGIRCWKRRHRRGTFEVGESGDIEHVNCGINRLILLAGHDSVQSPSVLRELDWALRREESAPDQATTVLITIATDDYAKNGWQHPSSQSLIDHCINELTTPYPDLLKSLIKSLKST